MKDLNINLIYAKTPQAKGRIERLWNTLQSRLPIEFKIAGITNMKQANTFLKEYILKYNEQFAKEPESSSTSFRKLDKNMDLDNILCKRETRKLDNGATFSFKNDCYQLIKDNITVAFSPKTEVMILILRDNSTIRVKFNNEIYDTRIVEKRKEISKKKKSRISISTQDTKEIRSIPTNRYQLDLTNKKQALAYMYDFSSTDQEEKEIVDAIFSSLRARF